MHQVRSKVNEVLENFALWRDSERAHCTNDAELAELVFHKLFEPLEEFLQRTTGRSKGKDCQGTAVDLALYSFSLDIRIVVVLADMIRKHSSDKDWSKLALTLPCAESAKSDDVCALFCPTDMTNLV